MKEFMRFYLLFIALVAGASNVHAEYRKSALRGDIDAVQKNDSNALENTGMFVKNGRKGQLPPFYIFWAGRVAQSDKSGLYHLPLEDESDYERLKSDSFSIMICKEVEPVLGFGGVLEGLRVTNAKRYLWYDIDRESAVKNGKERWYWHGTRKYLDKNNPLVPDNCVLVMLNPKYVDPEAFEASMQKTEQKDAFEFVLPTIVLNDVTRMQIQSDNRALGSVRDIIQWHAKPQVIRCTMNGVDVTIPYAA